jgi:hypothetical protein
MVKPERLVVLFDGVDMGYVSTVRIHWTFLIRRGADGRWDGGVTPADAKTLGIKKIDEEYYEKTIKLNEAGLIEFAKKINSVVGRNFTAVKFLRKKYDSTFVVDYGYADTDGRGDE